MGFSSISFRFGHFGWRWAIAATLVWPTACLGAEAQDRLGDPAMAGSVAPVSIEASTADPDSLTVGSQALGAMAVPTTPLPAPVESESAATRVISPQALDDPAEPTWNLEDLPHEAALENDEQQAVAVSVIPHRGPGVSTTSSVAQARLQLSASQARLDRVNTAIGTMLERDYPTGEARLRLYAEQSDARRAVEAARSWVERFGGDDVGVGE